MTGPNDKSTIDFSTLSQNELVDSLGRINQDKFPGNYQACVAEIEKMKAAGKWSDGPVPDATLPPPPKPFSLRKRLLASVIDGLVVGGIGFLFYPLSEWINGLDQWGILPLWALSIIYTSVLDGPVGRGQTLGKRLVQIKVVSKVVNRLTWSQAITRGFFLIALIGWKFGPYQFFHGNLMGELIYAVIVWFSFGNFVSLVLHPQRRSLVDIATESIIVNEADAIPQSVQGMTALKSRRAWVGVAAASAVVFGGYSIYSALRGFDPSGRYDELKYAIGNNTAAVFQSAGPYRFYRNGNLAASGTNFFFSLPAWVLADPGMVQIEAKKIRGYLGSPKYGLDAGNKTIVITGTVFKGLLPVWMVYKNPDADRGSEKK